MEKFRMSHSGEGIDLIVNNTYSTDDSLFIKKWESFDKRRGPRLIKQITKQRYQKNLLEKEDGVSVPSVIDETYGGSDYEVFMEYIHGKDCVAYFDDEEVRQEKVQKVAKSIKRVFNTYLTNCVEGEVHKQRFINKFKSTLGRFDTDYDFAEMTLSFAERNLPVTINLPLGICHGDFTLANMIFPKDESNDIYIVDFLDNFIETPLQDAAKIRQDTKHHWSVHKYEQAEEEDIENIDTVKECFTELDKEVDEYLSQLLWYKKYYSVMQTLNLLRILPYTEDKTTKKYLKSEITNIITEAR